VIQTIGYLGSAGAAVMWVPQAVRAVRARHDAAVLAALSPAAYLVAIAFNALLLVYGLSVAARPVEVAGAVNLLCAGTIVAVLVSARMRPA
jgi:uncharacterized protein with PQ loop repeat